MADRFVTTGKTSSEITRWKRGEAKRMQDLLTNWKSADHASLGVSTGEEQATSVSRSSTEGGDNVAAAVMACT